MQKKRDRGAWASPPQEARTNKKRTLTLTPPVHAKLNEDAAAGVNISDVTDEALRRHYGLQGKWGESHEERAARLAEGLEAG
jgi:hypothetical protein